MTGYVLYVDDDAANLAVFCAALEDSLPVLTAKSGDEALSLLELHDVAVLLTDQRMPGMTGVELMQVAQARWPDTARMLVTAYSDIDEAAEAINRGQVHRYVRKPWEPTELKAMLDAARDAWLVKQQFDALQLRLRETERVYALGVVAATVAHDLRSPLFAVGLELETLDLHVKGDPAVPRDAAERSLQATREGLNTIGEIASSMEVTTRRRGEESIDLRRVVEMAARNVRTLVLQRGSLDVSLDAVPRVRGDATRLGQVVMNLLVNAAQALPERRSAERHEKVQVRLRAEGDEVVLEVSDTGAGIARGDLERIFDPFFTTKSDGGAGLGLAISKSIVEECGGRIAPTSAPGEGTTFRVTLPALPG